MFNVEKEINREPAIAIDTADRSGAYSIPLISDVKDYGRKNNLPYSVPRFVGGNHSYICTKYIGKHKEEIWITQINPIILSTQGFVYVEETQHGVEGTYLVPRHPRILAAWVEAGSLKPVQRELVGLGALQFQQALHAVNGLFISDFGLRIDNNEEYQNATDEERGKIVENYFKALKETYETELKENKDTKDYISAVSWAAEKIELSNAAEGVLPADIQKKLEEEDKEEEQK